MGASHAAYQKHLQTTVSQRLNLTLMPMTMVYFLFFLLVALTASSFFVLAAKWLSIPAAKASYFIFMFAAGMCHSQLFRKSLPEVYQLGIKWQFLYSMLLAIAVLFVSLFLFSIIGFAIPQYCLTGAAAFLLPSAIQLSWKYFNTVFAVIQYEPWLLPVSPPERKASLFINNMAIQLQVKVKCYDPNEKRYNVVIPAHLKLGEMFHRFLSDNEKKPVSIQLLDIDNEPFGWKFTLKKAIRNKLLDPGASLKLNGIRKNNTILAERVLVILPKRADDDKKKEIENTIEDITQQKE